MRATKLVLALLLTSLLARPAASVEDVPTVDQPERSLNMEVKPEPCPKGDDKCLAHKYRVALLHALTTIETPPPKAEYLDCPTGYCPCLTCPNTCCGKCMDATSPQCTSIKCLFGWGSCS